MLDWIQVHLEDFRRRRVAPDDFDARGPRPVGEPAGVADDQVAIKALLKFTTAEQELDVPEEVVFGYLDDADEDATHDNETDEAA